MSVIASRQLYTIHAGTFEGPIELLLHLIEERKMSINDVSLAAVTDEYIQHIQGMSVNDYSSITHFLGVASTLLLIKARSLVGNLELTEEEEESIDELQERLRLYQIYANVAKMLRPQAGHRMWYTRPFVMKKVVVFSPDPTTLNISNLSTIMGEVLTAVPEVQAPLPETRIRIVVHIEDIMDRLTTRVREAVGKISLRDFSTRTAGDAASPAERKVHAVVGFLAMLELARHGMIALSQQGVFEDIMIEKS
jgi:segregation and condensation protein A